jgi:hypothetical protein
LECRAQLKTSRLGTLAQTPSAVCFTFLVAELKDPIGANFLGYRDHIEIWMSGRR